MAMNGPTEAEIREAIGREILTHLHDQIGDIVAAVSWGARDALWGEDWRGDEERTYDRLISAIYDKADEAVRSVLRDELAGAFLSFAEAHPDMPRTA